MPLCVSLKTIPPETAVMEYLLFESKGETSKLIDSIIALIRIELPIFIYMFQSIFIKMRIKLAVNLHNCKQNWHSYPLCQRCPPVDLPLYPPQWDI